MHGAGPIAGRSRLLQIRLAGADSILRVGRSGRIGLQVAAVHELETEPSLDAQVAVRDLDIQGRGDLHDPVILNVERERAAHAAIGTDRVGLGLPRLVPLAGLRSSYSLRNIKAPVGQTPMQLPQ